MRPPPPPLSADAILAGLPATRVIGREVQVFAETDSTNDTVLRAGALRAREGLAVFAETQRAGRGRQGRPWRSAPGLGLWFSVLLRPPPETFEFWPQLAFWAALAVAETADEMTGGQPPAQIKWPNDVLLAGRKVAGILIETSAPPPGAGDAGRFVVVGIGLNVHHRPHDFPEELRSRAGSLAMCAPDRPPLPGRDLIAAAVLRRLDATYANWPAGRAAINLACGGRSPLRGRRVTVSATGQTGTVEGFDADGRLLLRADDGQEILSVSSGEIVPCPDREVGR